MAEFIPKNPIETHAQKSSFVQRVLPKTDQNYTTINFNYIHQGEKKTEIVQVPNVLLSALMNPGETNLRPLDAMRIIEEFYKETITPELDNAILKGGLEMSTAMLSSLVQESYRAHSVVAATERTVSKELFFEDDEVKKCFRLVAALILGKSVEEISELDLDKTTVFVTRTERELVLTPKVELKTTKLLCDSGSHPEEIDVALPCGTTVESAQKIREQKLASLPKIKDALDDTFSKIEEKRGSLLDNVERNAIISHINVTYLENPQDRIPIVP